MLRLPRSDPTSPPARLPGGRCNAGLAGISSPKDALAGGRCWSEEERVIRVGSPLPGSLTCSRVSWL